MQDWLLNELSDEGLFSGLGASDRAGKKNEALLIAHIAAVDERRLFLRKGYDCMRDYCVHELNHSEDGALRRIRVGRAARKHPPIFTALAEGRLHLTAVLLLAPHLSNGDPTTLVQAAMHQTRPAIERMLAEKFPAPDLATTFAPIVQQPTLAPVAPELPVPSEVCILAPSNEPAIERPRVTPLSKGRTGLQTTVDDETLALLEEYRALVSHAVVANDLNEVLKRALTIAVAHERKRKFGLGAAARTAATLVRGRHVPASMKQAVFERDGGCCSFVGEDGHRCGSRHLLEVDHIESWAEGGTTTLENRRLLCRAHNQYEASRRLGEARMSRARDRAERERQRTQDYRRREAERAAKREAKEQAEAEAAALQARDGDLVSALRTLGFSREEASRGAVASVSHAHEPLETRLPVALRALTRHLGQREDLRPTVAPKRAAA